MVRLWMDGMLEYLTAEDFASRLQENFVVSVAGSPLDLVLVEVDDLGPVRPERNAFSLLFTGPAAPILPQAIYPMENPALGALDLFLVPIGRRDGGICYQAIFT